MKARRTVILALAFTLLLTGVASTSSMWGTYEGYSKVQLYLNGSRLDTGDGVPAFLINGSTVLPLRQVAESMNAIVQWDGATQTAKIYKPNVSIFVAEKVYNNGDIKTPFGAVEIGHKRGFDVFVQVDNLQIPIDGIKLSVLDPKGKEVASTTSQPNTDYGSNFWFTYHFDVQFVEEGNYKIQFALKVADRYQVVEEKLIQVFK